MRITSTGDGPDRNNVTRQAAALAVHPGYGGRERRVTAWNARFASVSLHYSSHPTSAVPRAGRRNRRASFRHWDITSPFLRRDYGNSGSAWKDVTVSLWCV